ncbi:hypothetical protein [Trichococcus shcherbakoviae]|uniref:hypothetical protein n=1 Tax=Trichococcus shcherbakoviae TaxID=2094020 RepID=UPI002AA81809|nr:hypothetical protein [Trichococcus shcherbakoviae]
MGNILLLDVAHSLFIRYDGLDKVLVVKQNRTGEGNMGTENKLNRYTTEEKKLDYAGLGEFGILHHDHNGGIPFVFQVDCGEWRIGGC